MKKYSIYLLTIALVMLNGLVLTAQNHYNIRLSLEEMASTGKVCYTVQLASAEATDINLAGQNYRLYFDGTKLIYNDGASQNLLPKEKYTPLVIKDNLQNIDASGGGPLAFDHHLSFLNIGNDLSDELNGGIILPASGDWVNTATICFDLVDVTDLRDENAYGIYWARPSLSQSYATAYVEVAEWTAPFVTVPAKATTYYDQVLSTSIDGQGWEYEPKVYPVPTMDKVFIDFEGTEALSLQIYAANGQLVLEDQYPAYTQNYSISMGHLASGIYQLKLSSKDKQIVKRIEKIQ